MADSSHGHTPAAWTGVSIAFIGFCVAGVFMVADNPLGFWGGMAVIVLGGVVGGIMRALGMGLPKQEPLKMVQTGTGTGTAQRVVTREPVAAEG
ncbi:HGxxPAAW family protein [Streptomyces sp. NPDC093252]|uniref:HGxxPAAW family protein n=1 Tax=Streptomyces sp. NPDC093252 TaxID=3154980 RepID=UPI003447543C